MSGKPDPELVLSEEAREALEQVGRLPVVTRAPGGKRRRGGIEGLHTVPDPEPPANPYSRPRSAFASLAGKPVHVYERGPEDGYGLSAIEREAVNLLVAGQRNKQVARALQRTEGWVCKQKRKPSVRAELDRMGYVALRGRPRLGGKPPPPPPGEGTPPAPALPAPPAAQAAPGPPPAPGKPALGFEPDKGLSGRQSALVVLRSVQAAGKGGRREDDLASLLRWFDEYAVLRCAVDMACRGEIAMVWREAGGSDRAGPAFVMPGEPAERMPVPGFSASQILAALGERE